MSRLVSKFASTLSFAALLAVFTISSTNIASAVSGSDWNAGRIIDDSVFFNSTSMSTTDIQNFLNTKVPTCDTMGQQTIYDSYYGDTVTRQTYSSRRGVSTPFTCLKDFHANTTNIAPESGICGGYTGASNESAATIIYNVAQSCGISPKVILVTLQKEQSLVTDDWPWPVQYEKAMGAFCPDTSPCDTGYGGFFKQVYYGANRFKVYGANPSSFNYRAYRNNTIYFNPGPCQTYSSGTCTKFYGNKYDSTGKSVPDITYCGSTSVYINSQSTADLYIYTPYQPNQAALNNLYGEGDICSAYGNRNFWRMFNDWFGTTYGPYFAAQFRAQSPYPYVMTGDSTNIYMQFINTGNTFWKDDVSTFPGYPPIHLAATNPINRVSDFRASNWLSGSRPNGTFTKVLESDGWTLAADQHTVQPGQIVEFQYSLKIPLDYNGGVYREYFQPVAEGINNYSLNTWSYIDVYVIKSQYNASYNSQSPYPSMLAGDTKPAYYQFKNNGNVPWYDDTSVPTGKYPVHFATTGPINRSSIFNASWPAGSRTNLNFSKVYEADGVTLANDQHVVQPGQIARFDFNIHAPSGQKAGLYREYFQPVLEGAKEWEMGQAAYLDVTVNEPQFKATYHSQSAYPTISRGQTKQVYFQFKNTGNIFWKDDTSAFPGFPAMHLATTFPINRNSSLYSATWSSTSRPAGIFKQVFEADGTTLASDQHTVQPGQIARFEFDITAPVDLSSGTYREYFQPVIEGSAQWDLGAYVYQDIVVQ